MKHTREVGGGSNDTTSTFFTTTDTSFQTPREHPMYMQKRAANDSLGMSSTSTSDRRDLKRKYGAPTPALMETSRPMEVTQTMLRTSNTTSTSQRPSQPR